MLLKFKNKYIMTLDKLIKEGGELGGLIESIVLEPKEGTGLILEIINLGVKYTKNIEILDTEGKDITREKLIWGGRGLDKNEHIKSLINQWYKIQCVVTYKDIPLCIVKPNLEVLKPEKGVGWTESHEKPKAEEIVTAPEKKVEISELNNIIKSWKLYPEPPNGHKITGINPTEDVLPPITNGFIDSQSTPPEPPNPPPGRILKDGTIATCGKCGSNMKTKFFFFKTGGCIQPECENYWGKQK